MYPILKIGSLEIQTYFLVMIALFVGSLIWVYKKSLKFNLDKNLILDLTFLLAFSGIIFARFFHVIFENPQFYLGHPWYVLYFWNGGFVFLGGLVGAIVTGILYLFIKRKKDLLPKLLDFFAPVIALNYSLGRIGCFLAGCCYGKACPYPWAIHGLHPTQLYAFVSDFLLFLILIKIERKFLPLTKKSNTYWRQGYLFCIWMFFHGLGRFILEFYRDDFRGIIHIFSLSGWISLMMMISSGVLYLYFKKPIDSK